MSFLESFRAARWIRTLNLVLQALLFLSLFLGLNYLALHYSWRYDLTATRRHSLSPETKSYLEGLQQPVDIIVTLTPNNQNDDLFQAYNDVTALLREFAYATETSTQSRINVQTLDVYQRAREAKTLEINQPDSVVVKSGKKQRVLTLADLYRIEKGERKAFLGEQAITAAILDISSARKNKIYFTIAHGELQVDDVDPQRGLSALADTLRTRNFTVEALDLTRDRKIPDDADLVVIAGPQGRFEPFEEELLRQYLGPRAGRVVVLLPPMVRNSGLDTLLYDWGVLGDDVVVIDNQLSGQTDTGDLIIYPTLAGHPITQFLVANSVPMRFGSSRAMRPDLGRAVDPSLIVTPLAGTTAESAWGERGYLRPPYQFNAGVDIPGPVPVATASERVTPKGNLPFSVRGGRLVAFGSADFIANGRFGTLGNQSIMLSAINWTVDRDAQLIVAPRLVERFQLSLSQQDLLRLRYTLLLGLPGAALLLGLLVTWTRRR